VRAVPSLSVVIVTYNSRDALAVTLPPLVAQLREGDELIVVDNDSADASPAAARELAPSATVIEAGANSGFAAGCNRGAAAAGGELLVFLNPDAVPQPGWRDAIELPLTDGRDWAAWQALVTAEGGRALNTRGGVIHFTGIAWAGGAGRVLAELPASEPVALEDPGFVSGACLAIRRATYLELGGMPEEFFLYQEDVDLSLRLRLRGGRLGVEPAARVDHEYEFAKGKDKWRHLERNRWATIVRTYPGALLWALMPALLATELALVPASIAGGWFPQKLAAWADVWRALPRLARERRAIQAGRSVGAAQFATALTPQLDSAYLGRAARSRPLAALLRGYWALTLRLVGGG
jgi:GT2 family glycosyltransferase